ncbi:alpha/beta fold hydrolase, partial [Actinoplanes sp. NPDC024001]|uniref:alpha/beta fold hydrolase n=1 Tax=Actinoplanes sp. NPDC024001 TaxID=3154598 RepID=UPI0033FF2838
MDGIDTFYREAGPPGAPVLRLPHGYPSSSFQFRNLMPALADRWRTIAPDFPGFGYRDAGQCSGLQAGGEGPCWEGRQGPSSALTSRLLALLGHGDRHDRGDPAAVIGHVDDPTAHGDVVEGGGERQPQFADADLV